MRHRSDVARAGDTAKRTTAATRGPPATPTSAPTETVITEDPDAQAKGRRIHSLTSSGVAACWAGTRDALQRVDDVKRERKDLYAPKPGAFEIVDVPETGFLMIDGHGDPNTSASYREAVEALYAASYAVRAVAKAKLLRVHTVAPLEGLWSADDPEAFRTRDKDSWDWTVMIAQARHSSACMSSSSHPTDSCREAATTRSTSLMPARRSPAG